MDKGRMGAGYQESLGRNIKELHKTPSPKSKVGPVRTKQPLERLHCDLVRSIKPATPGNVTALTLQDGCKGIRCQQCDTH